jgi:citrate lyase subunit beta/citryl-CoA lyase
MAPSSYRPRRTCLAVPGSSPRFLEKARGLPVDEVFLDLEDAVAPGAKPAARAAVVAALNGGGWAGKIRAVRINDASTPWAYRDVIEVVEGAGPNLDVIILPKPATRPRSAGWICCCPRWNRRPGWSGAGSALRPRSRTPAAWRT